MDLDTFLKRIPKAELHCHLEGSVKASTFVDLANRNSVPIPDHRDPQDLYECRSFPDFLTVYKKVCHSMRSRDDFRRVTYESLEEAHASGVRYREMFWSPTDHLKVGVRYEVALDGIIEGIHDAETDLGIVCRLIADINREESPETGVEMVDLVVKHRRGEVIGIGLDYNEEGNPPEKFWKAFRMAEQAGLHRTAHVAEMGGHPRNVETCLDLLGCERLDHGYRVLEDDRIAQRCANEGVIFTVVPTAHRFALMDEEGLIHWERHPIREMAARGMRIVINSDDPAMMKITPAGAYAHAVRYFGFGPEDVKRCVVNGIEGAWLGEATRRLWRMQWTAEIEALAAKVDAQPGP
jgi:adenosine deaminase